METSLHGDDFLASEHAADDVALVTYRGGDGETGNVAVGDDYGVLDLLAELAEAAAEHDSDGGFEVACALPDMGCRGFDVV